MIRRPGRLAVLIAALLALAGPASATTSAPVTNQIDRAVAAPEPAIALTGPKVLAIAKTATRVPDWLREHPEVRERQPFRDTKTPRVWTVPYADASGATVAQVIVRDSDGKIIEERIGPQVAWQMARGYDGAFGRSLTEPQIWLPLFALFLLPLIRWRRLVSWHTLDLVMLSAFGISLIWFNEGNITVSVPLAFVPLLYLAIRLAFVGVRKPPPAPDRGDEVGASPVRRPRMVSWCPTWLLVALMFLALGLRIGLNVFDSNVIDVGYAGVIGADRIIDGQAPYGTIDGDTCRHCDTYGPALYLLYIPFETVLPWTGSWDDLPAAHGAATFFDLAALAGLLLLGWRMGGRRLAAGFGLAWTAFPFTAYALESNANDSLIAACVAWGMVAAHRPFARGVWLGVAVFAKFTPAILIPLWARHPFPRAKPARRWPRYLLGLAAVGVTSAWVLVLDGRRSLSQFWDRTIGFQLGRDSPFSIWGQYPGLRPVQIGLIIVVGLAAVVLAVRPRERDLRQMAALSGALIAGLQLTMTHWFYLYLPWFLPFAIVALLPAWSPQKEPAGEEPQTVTTERARPVGAVA